MEDIEALVSNDLSEYVVNDSISVEDQAYYGGSLENRVDIRNLHHPWPNFIEKSFFDSPESLKSFKSPESHLNRSESSGQSHKKRRRRTSACKNKEVAETQRMTHITVERNRRKQMNEHLTVLRSLMPESYLQRGDQASIVGGAIDFVKELEQLLQSLEAQKQMFMQLRKETEADNIKRSVCNSPFSQFFSYPQYSMKSQISSEFSTEFQPAIADIEVKMIETHANLRILAQKKPRQLVKMVSGLHALRLSILHLNITTLPSLVFYSFNLKVEEGCQLTSVDDIAGAVHQILTRIEEEILQCGQ